MKSTNTDDRIMSAQESLVPEARAPELPTLAALDRIIDDPRSEPPQVYRACERDCWVVQAPPTAAADTERTIFTGLQAQQQALMYAYETFGNARFFPY